MEFIARHFSLLIYLVGAVAALITGWRLYKEGYLAKFGQIIIDAEATASDPEKSAFVFNWGGVIGALLFIAGTTPYFVSTLPEIYLAFISVGGLICYLSYRRTGKLDPRTLIFPVGAAMACGLPFVLENRAVYTILMGVGLAVTVLSVVFVELMKLSSSATRQHARYKSDRRRAAEEGNLGPSPALPSPAESSRHSTKVTREKRISRKNSLTVAVIICGGVGIWLANNYRPAPEISNGDVIDRYRYAFIAFSIGIFTAAYGYSRIIWLSLMSAALLFIPLLGPLYFLNAALDTPHKASYLITDKYEKRKRGDNGPYTIYYLEGIDEKTERATLFSSARGDFSMGQYRSIDPDADAYWMHVEEGEGFFDLRWRKEVFGLFDHPLPPPVDASGK